MPAWAAVLIAVVLTGIGVVLNLNGENPGGEAIGWALRIAFVGGVVIAVLAVRRRAVFTGMVQPPLVLAAALLIGGLVSSKGLVLSGVDVVKSFPLMVVGTAAAVVIGLIRLVAQPLRRRDSTAANQERAHA